MSTRLVSAAASVLAFVVPTLAASPVGAADPNSIISATLNSRGTAFSAKFNTDLEQSGPTVSCSHVFKSSTLAKLGADPVCYFSSARVVKVTMGPGATIRPGVVVAVNATTLRSTAGKNVGGQVAVQAYRKKAF